MIRLLQYRPGAWLRSGGQLFGWMLVRATALALTVLLLARLLGAHGYGQFVVLLAVASFVSPLVGLGLCHIVLRNGAKDRDNLDLYLGIAARWWRWTLLPGMALVILLATWLVPDGVPWRAALAAVCVEVTASSLVELCSRHRQAGQRIAAFGAITAGLPLFRLFALGVLFLWWPAAGVQSVLWVHAASGLAYVALLLPTLHGLPYGREGKEPMVASSGLAFTVSVVAARLQGEFNKPVLAHSAFAMAGTYSAAQRFVDLACMPLIAMQESLWPRLYAHENPMRALVRAGCCLVGLALACAGFLWMVGPLLPWLLGTDYASAARTLQWLALLPVLQTLRSLLSFHWIHHGRMRIIGLAYVIGAVIGVLAVAGLVPDLGIVGAVLAAYVSELAMIFVLVTRILRK